MIKLKTRKPDFWRSLYKAIPLDESKPFYKGGKKSVYHHRVRYAEDVIKNNVSQTLVTFWCGSSGYAGRRSIGDTLESVPEGGIMCSTCAGRVIGAGVDGTEKTINGETVMYQPATFNLLDKIVNPYEIKPHNIISENNVPYILMVNYLKLMHSI